MKKILSFLFLLTLTGCASVAIPNYIQDEHPYRKEFYGAYDDVLNAVTQGLHDLGWEVAKAADPSVFEQGPSSQTPGQRQILIFTEIRQTALFVGTRYARINVYLNAPSPTTVNAELRYITVTSVPFKSFNSYRNDGFAKRLFDHVEKILAK